MPDTIPTCTGCGRQMSVYNLCDREDGAWCDDCFRFHPCGKGQHGEGCPSWVVDDGAAAAIKAQEAPDES